MSGHRSQSEKKSNVSAKEMQEVELFKINQKEMYDKLRRDFLGEVEGLQRIPEKVKSKKETTKSIHTNRSSDKDQIEKAYGTKFPPISHSSKSSSIKIADALKRKGFKKKYRYFKDAFSERFIKYLSSKSVGEAEWYNIPAEKIEGEFILFKLELDNEKAIKKAAEEAEEVVKKATEETNRYKKMNDELKKRIAQLENPQTNKSPLEDKPSDEIKEEEDPSSNKHKEEIKA